MLKIEQIGKDLMEKIENNLEDNVEKIEKMIKDDLGQPILNQIKKQESNLRTLPNNSKIYLKSIITEFKSMTEDRQLLIKFCTQYIADQKELANNLPNIAIANQTQQQRKNLESLEKHIKQMEHSQDTIEKLKWTENENDKNNIDNIINLMKSHGKLLTSIFTETKKRQFQMQLNTIKQKTLEYHEQLNNAMGQEVKTQLVLNSPDRKIVRLITFNSIKEILNYLKPGYSSDGELTYRYQIDNILSQDIKVLEEKWKKQGIDISNIKIVEIKQQQIEEEHLKNLFQQYINARVKQAKNETLKIIERLKELTEMKRFYRTTELQALGEINGVSLLDGLVKNGIITKSSTNKGYLINQDAKNLFKDMAAELEDQLVQQVKDDIEKGFQQNIIHAHAQNFGILNEAFFAAYLEAVRGNNVDLQAFIDKVDNLSGMLQGDISWEGIEYAVKTTGASMMSIPQLIQTAKIISTNFNENRFLELGLFLFSLKKALHKGVGNINKDFGKEVQDGIKEVLEPMKNS